MSYPSKELLAQVKCRLVDKLKELYLEDLKVNNLKVSNISQSKKTIEFEELSIKLLNKKTINICPEIYTPKGFDKLILNDTNVQVDIGLDFNSNELSKEIFKRKTESDLRKVFKHTIQEAALSKLKDTIGENIEVYAPKVKAISSSGKVMYFKDIKVSDLNNNKYEIKTSLNMKTLIFII